MTDEPRIISATIPDWAREEPRRGWDPSRKLLRSIRKYQALGHRRSIWAKIVRKWWILQHRFWSTITQAEISLDAEIAGGLILPHPNGIVIHPNAVIGPNCLIFQQVTIGTVAKTDGAAKIGGNVDIGAGAKLLGPISVGDHAVIGASAVVACDVPERSVAVGVPAKIRPPSA